ncbi:Cytochrome-c oxidase [Pseudopedobacter saltans DSM 12145]|uniref:Cytochrome-c oxidase n=2 Tax=Pseudopedobacter saltans TaxID=151895 RepID=F0SCX1_PSESL|nr:Cytochrome-c oxidase [Pseudopedobacter saltans DSM 12145]
MKIPIRSLFIIFLIALPSICSASEGKNSFIIQISVMGSLFFALLIILMAVLHIKNKADTVTKNTLNNNDDDTLRFKKRISNFNIEQIDTYLSYKKEPKTKHINRLLGIAIFALLNLSAQTSFSQTQNGDSPLSSGGIIITIILILIPVLAGITILIIKLINALDKYKRKQDISEAIKLSEFLESNEDEAIEQELIKRKKALDFRIPDNQLSGNIPAEDTIGLLNDIEHQAPLPLVAAKKKALQRHQISPALSKLIIWYIGAAAFWLLFGTTIGEYLGIKFMAPEADSISWLSFGRLRPVHTNAVFWGWASLAMLGLGHYIIPRVSNTPIHNIKLGWWAFALINITVISGTLSLMAGINNSGGEYREYIWPIMLPFAIALVITVINFIKTIAKRKTKEIYISNWYMIASILFTIVISLVAYLPFWQHGLGETIVQGYYMHQGVGMWFMLFTLGIVYYFLPQQLNKPIYSYSLGILAFWAQILFYTLIGTHHFIFSSIPWWLQTTAIIGSMGMVIPVAAGTANFLLTFNGSWYKIGQSYTLPFFLVGIVFYFTGSLQGTAEAFRYTNLLWHFTDFTVAHSHLTMYGIISFFLWAAIYALIPRLTGKEAPQLTVGIHFWLAIIGLLIYTVPLMYGSTLKGMLWMEGKPFIEGIVLMAPYWLWRAIGGSLMWLSHLFFIYNLYKMLSDHKSIDINEMAINRLNKTVNKENAI